MVPDPPPDHVRLAKTNLGSVAERGTPVGCPGQLPHTLVALHAMDTEPRREPRRPVRERLHELIACAIDSDTLLACESSEFARKPRPERVRR